MFEIRIGGPRGGVAAGSASDQPADVHRCRSGAAPTARGARSRWRRGESARGAVSGRAGSCRGACATTTRPPELRARWGLPGAAEARCTSAGTTTPWKRVSPSTGDEWCRCKGSMPNRSGTTTSRTRRRSRSRTRRAGSVWCRSSTTSPSGAPNESDLGSTGSTPRPSACIRASSRTTRCRRRSRSARSRCTGCATSADPTSSPSPAPSPSGLTRAQHAHRASVDRGVHMTPRRHMLGGA